MKLNAIILPSAVLCVALFFHGPLSDFWWHTFGPFLTHSLQVVFKTIFSGAVDAIVESDGVLRVMHPRLTVLINRHCAGFDGVLLFSILFFLAYAAKRASLTVRQWLSFFWSGIAFMILVNAVRVVSLFVGGIWLREWFGSGLGSFLLRQVAHAHGGWITYLLSLAFFFPAMFRLLLRDRRSVRRTLEGNQRTLGYR